MKQKHTLQWLSAVTGRAKGLVGLLVVVQTVLSVSSIAFAFVLRRIINMAVDGARGGFWASLALLVGILLGQIMLSAAGRFLSEYTGATVENRFKHRLFSALLTGDYASVAAVHSGEWMNRLTSDTTVVAGGVTQIVPGLIGMLVRLLGAVAAILWLEPRFLYILLPGGAAMLLLTYAFRKILKRLHSNHPILLLDEATSALDEATALRLLNNLRKMTDKTVILVTHRMNQAGFFDAELAFSKDGICVRERKTCK